MRRPSLASATAVCCLYLAGCGSGSSHPATSTAGDAGAGAGTISGATAGTGTGTGAGAGAGTGTSASTAAAVAGLPNLCATLKAHLEGIEHAAAFGDPQPAALKGRLPAIRVARAATEAEQASREFAAHLPRTAPTAPSRHALRRAERSYRRLARRLGGRSARNGSAGLRMQASFLQLAAAEIQGCLGARQGQ
jgi:hypothetical protein